MFRPHTAILIEFKKWMCYIDGQKNKYSVLNECSRMLKYNIFKTIFYCHNSWDPPPQPGGPGPGVYIPQGQDDQVIPPGTGFLFCRLFQLAGLQWRYSNLSPLGFSSWLQLMVSMSWCRAHTGTCDQILLPVGRLLSESWVEVLFLWGTLSDERMGLQFAVQSLGPSQQNP
jgi:hypothetical protein